MEHLKRTFSTNNIQFTRLLYTIQTRGILNGSWELIYDITIIDHIHIAVRSRNWLTGLSGLRHYFFFFQYFSLSLYLFFVFPCLILLLFSGALSGGPSETVCLFSSRARARVCVCASAAEAGDPDKPVLCALSLYHTIILYIQQRIGFLRFTVFVCVYIYSVSAMTMTIIRAPANLHLYFYIII